MRTLVPAFGISMLLISPYVLAQQPSSAVTVSRDPQALTLLGQAVNVAGGAAAVSAITDYTAIGTGTWYQDSAQSFDGSITISGTSSGQLRFDANLPTGIRSYSVNHGHSAWQNEQGTITQATAPHAVVPSSNAFPYNAPMFSGAFASPQLALAAILQDSSLEVLYKGSVQINGRSTYEIQVRRPLPGRSNPTDPLAEYTTMHLFIDASTSQVVMTQDMIPKHVIHQLQYSDYRSAGAVVLPFSITEFMGGQLIWAIHLSQINFNSGLQDSSFQLQ